VQRMVRALLNMQETPEPTHAADALAIGLCYLQARELEQRFGIARKQGDSVEKAAVARARSRVSSEATITCSPRIPRSR